MDSPATARPPGRSRLALIVAGVLALLGSLVVTHLRRRVTMTIPTTVSVPVPTAAVTTRPATTIVAPRAAVTDAAIQAREVLFTSVAMSYANMSSGAMVTTAAVTVAAAVPTATTVATAVPTAIIPTGTIGPGRRGPIRGAMAVSGTGERRMATNHPPIDMRSRRGRLRRLGRGPATKPVLMATRTECRPMLAAIQHCRDRSPHKG